MADSDDDDALAATVDSGEIDVQAPLGRGTALDRYILIGVLGGGGMGMVYAAYDPELDRKLAVKLLRVGETPAAASSRGRARLQREAQAMARLQHPNVIAVYDVGTFRDQVFVAMEYVDGVTLRSWMHERPRSWREVLEVFLPAGRALGAAHQARIVHRDFKPDNVMVGKDGRVRVLDFGLARGALDDGVAAPRDEPAGMSSGSGSALETPLTQTGSLLGTPMYMSPEQWLREPVEEPSDQFSYCIALWEALYGARPFAGTTSMALGAAVVRGDLQKPPADRAVPAWLKEVVARGLQNKPGDRHPSMDALVSALSSDPEAERRRRRRLGVLVLSFASLAAVAVFGLVKLARVGADRCRGAESRLAGVWDGARRGALRAAFAGTGTAAAAEIAERVVGRLDAYAQSWTRARTDACEATHVRGEQSEKLLDLRMACLDRRLGELKAQADLFAAATDFALVSKAPEAVGKLTPLAGCADARALESVVPLPDDPTVRTRVAELRKRLLEAKAREDAGQYPPALEAAKAVVAESLPLGYAPLHAEALYRRASVEENTGKAAAAEQSFGEALPLAAQGRDDVLAARIWAELLFVIGLDEARPNDALLLRPAAEAAVLRAAGDPEARGMVSTNLGTLYSSQGKYDDARKSFERAITSFETAFGADHVRVANALNNLGIAQYRQGKLDEARRTDERALAIYEKELGPDHPRVATALTNLANVLGTQGEHEQSLRLEERALAIKERTLGPDHPAVAGTLGGIGEELAALGRYADARVRYERALAIGLKTRGPEHPSVAATLHGLGVVVTHQGRYAEARALLDRALAIQEKTLGPEHPDTASTHVSLGSELVAEKRVAEALAQYRRAAEIQTKALGPDHVQVAETLTSIARTELLLGHVREAIDAGERALRIRDKGAQSPIDRAESQFVVARALWAAGDHHRSLELAEAARVGFSASEQAQVRKDRAEVESWLLPRRPPS